MGDASSYADDRLAVRVDCEQLPGKHYRYTIEVQSFGVQVLSGTGVERGSMYQDEAGEWQDRRPTHLNESLKIGMFRPGDWEAEIESLRARPESEEKRRIEQREAEGLKQKEQEHVARKRRLGL